MPDVDLDNLEEQVANPAAAEVDGVVVRQHSLKDQIEFYKLKKGQDSNPIDTSKASTGFRVSIFVPPGSV